MTKDVIQASLTKTYGPRRRQCHVCGGVTETGPVMAEGQQDLGPSIDGKGRDYRTVRVCDQCMKGADGLSIDQRLDLFARWLDAEAEAEAELTRAMIGKIQVTSHAEWEAACDEIDGPAIHF